MLPLYVLKAFQATLALLVVASLYVGWHSLASDLGGHGLPPVSTRPGGDPREGATVTREQDYDIIARRALFVAVEEPAPPPPPEPTPPPVEETELNIELLGTVVFGAPADPRNRANIVDVDGRTVSVRLDQVIAQGKAVVEAIEKERIVISHGDRRESVSLPPAPEAPKPEIRAGVAGAGEPDDGRIVLSVGPPDGDRRRSPPRRTSASRRVLDTTRELRRPQRVSPVASATRVVRQAVDFEVADDAVRISSVTEGGRAEELGFRAGDRVLAVNGVALDGRSVPPGLVQSFIRGGDPVVSLEDGNGGQRQITIPREMLTEPDPTDAD